MSRYQSHHSPCMCWTWSRWVLAAACSSLIHSSLSAHILYVTRYQDGHLAMIDESHADRQSTIPGVTGGQAMGIALSHDQSKIYVTSYVHNNLLVIDTHTQSLEKSITVGLHPVTVVLSPDGTRLYVANSSSGSVSVIDTASETLIYSVPVGYKPSDLAITPDGSKVYVTNYSSNHISEIDTQTYGVVHIPLEIYAPIGIAITEDGSTLYVASAGTDSVYVLNRYDMSLLALIPGFTAPYAIETGIVGGKRQVYVTNYKGNTLSVLDGTTQQLLATIPVGAAPAHVRLSPDGTTAYVTNYRSNTISVIDTARHLVTRTIPVSEHPVNLVLGPSLPDENVSVPPAPDPFAIVLLSEEVPETPISPVSIQTVSESFEPPETPIPPVPIQKEELPEHPVTHCVEIPSPPACPRLPDPSESDRAVQEILPSPAPHPIVSQKEHIEPPSIPVEEPLDGLPPFSQEDSPPAPQKKSKLLSSPNMNLHLKRSRLF